MYATRSSASYREVIQYLEKQLDEKDKQIETYQAQINQYQKQLDLALDQIKVLQQSQITIKAEPPRAKFLGIF